MIFINNIIKNSPHWINWNAPILQALIGKKNCISNASINESKDYNCGAICNELEFFHSQIQKEAKNRNFQKSKSDLLEYFAQIVAGESKLLNENDASYIKRLLSFCEMNGCETRTTKEALLAFLKYFYSWCEIMEGISNEVEDDFSNWNWTQDNIVVSKDKSFTGKAIELTSTSTIQRRFTGLKSGYRQICFFTKSAAIGKIGTLTIDGKNYELNCSTSEWEQHDFLVKISGEVQITIAAHKSFVLDYFHLFREEAPCFTVLKQKQSTTLEVAEDDAVTGYSAKREIAKKSDTWNYFLRPDNLTEQSDAWVLKKLEKLKAKGIKTKIIEVRL